MLYYKDFLAGLATGLVIALIIFITCYTLFNLGANKCDINLYSDWNVNHKNVG